MKSRTMILYVITIAGILGSLAAAQDNLPLPPAEYGGDNVPLPPEYGGGMSDNVPLPPGYGSGMGGGGGGGMMGGMPEAVEFPEDVAARCVLKVSCDPSVMRLDYRIMRHLWFSTGVLNKAYRTVLNDGNSLNSSGYIILISDGGAPAQMIYSVAIPEMGYGKEKEILAAAVENLKTALSQMGDQELERLVEQFRLTERQCSEAEGPIAEMQKQIRAITEMGITNRQEVQEKISRLQNSLTDIEMRLQYSTVRINELNKQKVELQSAIEKALAADIIIEELKNIVKGAQESVELAEKRFNSGQGPMDKLQEAKEKLTRAKIELARRVEEMRANAGQTQLGDIDGKIAAVNSEISETTMRRSFNKEEYEKTRQFLAKCDELELLEMKLDAAKRSFHGMLNLRENLKNRLQTRQPLSVTVIGME